jgi:PEP-CTERM motif-containing protein
MRRLVLGLIGATALTMASAASATVVMTTPTSVSVSGPNTFNGDFTFGYSNSATTSPFSETVSWMNDLAGLYSLSLTTSAVTADGPTDVDISGAFLTGTDIIGQLNLIPDVTNTDLSETFRLLSQQLGAGTYTLTVEGTRGEAGSYGGNVAFEAHPTDVPEPGTWGLMLLGFGAVGWHLRRRRSSALLAQAA